MQKLKQELNANPVGADASVRPHFEEMTLKNQKGITLIALIITIIVMLILVGVTINVALNGGLFEKAETAKTETNKALEKEELMQIAVSEYNVQSGLVNVDNVKTQTGANYTEDTSKSINGKSLVLQGESGTFWEINLESALVKEYEEPTTISTIWQQRGVTSTNVKVDTLYYNGEISVLGWPKGMTFGLYSNGDICMNHGIEIIENKDLNGDNNIGTNGSRNADIVPYFESDIAQGFSNGITFPTDSTNWLTVRYTSDNKINLYVGETSNLNADGNIPEDETYFVGTLLSQ